MVRVTAVDGGSPAERHGMRPGDMLVSINNNGIRDVLDYRFYLAERSVAVRFLRDGEEHTVIINKGEYDDIGLEFELPLMDKERSCANKCIFCFIEQNPKGMRDTIYYKDDDSRLSFIHGNYITLTNMKPEDIHRIVRMKFSPVNISVHTTNPELRVRMMKNKNAGRVLSYLKILKEGGIQMCGQIVLCRGVNDGAELVRTLTDLEEYFPEMSSVSVVPAGLTKFREGLCPLSDFTKEEAGAVIDTVDRIAEAHKADTGSRMFFVADEMYLKAGREIPPAEYYEGYPQLENGVGLLRSFSDEFGMAAEDIDLLRADFCAPRHVSVATGVAAYPMIASFAARLMALVPGLTVNVYRIINNFYGESITVSGLLTGKDLAEQLAGKELGEALYLPENCILPEERLFLCGMSVDELSARLGVPVLTSPCDGYAFACAMLGVTG